MISYVLIRYVDGYDWYKKANGHGQIYFLSSEQSEYSYNRILSGYRVAKNRPGHKFVRTIKTNPDQPDVVIDNNGFIADVPVKRERSIDKIRVFVTGGSTALGAGQNDKYDIVKQYPQGVYSYSSSIPGRIRDFLIQSFPDTDFEVINASMMGNKFHQSFLHYIEQLSRFSPDIIVNIDGQNDAGSMWRGNPYEELEGELPKYIELLPLYREKPLFLRRTYSYQFLYRTYFKGNDIFDFYFTDKHQGDSESLKEIFNKRGPFREYSIDEYIRHENYFVSGFQPFLQILRQYYATLESDGVKFVFMLQPMLQRSINKPLNVTEQNLFTYRMHSAKYDTTKLVERFFIDRHLSPLIQAESERSGFGFIDANREIVDLPEELEFYTDYCHLTPEGNNIVAQLVFRELELIIRDENMHLNSQ